VKKKEVAYLKYNILNSLSIPNPHIVIFDHFRYNSKKTGHLGFASVQKEEASENQNEW
jgi:hypothetical protein